MNDDKITTFNDLYDLSQEYRKGKWVFRGIADTSFELVPKVGRPGMETHNEMRIFDFFKREAAAYSGQIPLSDWELLALGQHHGLPTRLLDWTENPLVAAYFACNEYQDEDAAIYMMKNNRVFKIDDNDKGKAKEKEKEKEKQKKKETKEITPFNIKKVTRYRPKHITKRISVQRGTFTVHPKPTEPLALCEQKSLKIRRVIIPKTFKKKLLWNLSRFDVNRRSLFPDLDGLALHIGWIFSDKDPSTEPYAPGTD